MYRRELSAGTVRVDCGLLKHLSLFSGAASILDFGSGAGGNVGLLASRLCGKRFALVDHSPVCLDHARRTLPGGPDSGDNVFEFAGSMEGLSRTSFDLVMAIEVIEHLKDTRSILDRLWDAVAPGGVLLVSVPVRGWRDRHREHVQAFTVGSMFKLLSTYTDWVHVAPRSYSQRSGVLSTAYFYVSKRR